jgi:arogenate dehydrogenase (NADP+), plant
LHQKSISPQQVYLIMANHGPHNSEDAPSSSSAPPPPAAAASAARTPLPHPRPQTIAIVGFGNFGQFLGKTFSAQGHRVVGQSRGDYEAAAAAIGCDYVRDPNTLMDRDPDVVVLCTSIMSLSSVLAAFPVERLAGRLVVDVLSVKVYPHDLLTQILPQSADILCTHPMFGPESARFSWEGLPFVYDIVRVNTDDPHAERRCADFIDVWKLERCKMVSMTCHVHDKYAASTQFLTHTTGRMLAELNVTNTPINTRGFESLLGVVDNTTKDSFDLFYGLYRYNPNSREQLDKLQAALYTLREKLDDAERREAQHPKT